MEKLVENLLEKIHFLAGEIKREIKLMEVCGTHTQTVVQAGIRNLMPKNVKLTQGPGCPVCITPQEDIEAIVNLALAGIPIVSYGDVLRVPGFKESLIEARKKGAFVREVYSVNEALELKEKIKNLVFFGIGFETTAPMTALAIKKGLTVYSAHRLFFPGLSSLIRNKKIKIDGLICPGHVSTIIGFKPYQKLKIPQVISGFEPEDVLISIYILLKQILRGERKVENEYKRSVKAEGNVLAQKLIFEVFEAKEGLWRGLGKIKNTALEIKKKYQKFDAKEKFKDILKKIEFPKLKKTACICDKIILGEKEPRDCPLFKKICFPENPKGPCMVSIEGTCYIYFKNL